MNFLQNVQNAGCLKKVATNLWPLISCVFVTLTAASLTTAVVWGVSSSYCRSAQVDASYSVSSGNDSAILSRCSVTLSDSCQQLPSHIPSTGDFTNSYTASQKCCECLINNTAEVQHVKINSCLSVGLCLSMSIYVYLCLSMSIYVYLCLSMSIYVYLC